MALVIPTAKSTFGDATSTPEGPLRRYILAQFPDDAPLDWVSEVRSLCVVDELKWKAFQLRRERLQAKKDLWSRIYKSMRSATIVVINPQETERAVRTELESQGAEEGTDFNQKDLIGRCATALIGDTPVAYLPNQLSRILGLYPENLYLSFDKFTPEKIKDRIGGTLQDAKVFAARAHATFDLDSLRGFRRSTTDAFTNPGASVVLQELLSTQRGFDIEHPKSSEVLNEAADIIAGALADVLTLPGELTEQPLVTEYDSKNIDQLQAADIAAGWAHELIALGNERALGDTFGKVLINGRILA